MIDCMADDLVMFAKHGKRAQVTSQDVLLLARKSKSLQQNLQKYEQENLGGSENTAAKKKRTTFNAKGNKSKS